VATTRARDRLIILGLFDAKRFGFSNWLQRGRALCEVREAATPEYSGPRPPAVALSWLDVIREGLPAPESLALPVPPQRFMTSATEQMARARDLRIWEQLYVYGVEPVWQFAPVGERPGLSERLRGDVIHGVLERIAPDAVLAQVLEETIGELDTPELEFVLAPGSEQRAELLAEIERVLATEEWSWYVRDEHHRELPFLHLAGPREWRIGAFDLFRPDGWVIDFKTHQISAQATRKKAEEYRLQMELYRAAAAVCLPVRTQLHFTHCNIVVEID
jgi:hypothetical protein